jgi:uncharacterized protein YjiS (DUF1127 family)
MSSVDMTQFTPARQRPSVCLLTLIADWNDERLTRRALSRLSRHELGDIGLEDIDGLFRR